jgi:hypothetical protein
MVFAVAARDNGFTVDIEDGDISVRVQDADLEKATQSARFRAYCLRLDCKKVPCIIVNNNTGEVVYRNYKARLAGLQEKSIQGFMYTAPFLDLITLECICCNS